jgi:hypothetical protein
MTIKEILLLIIAIAITVSIPAAMTWAAIDHIRHGHKREFAATGERGAAGVG